MGGQSSRVGDGLISGRGGGEGGAYAMAMCVRRWTTVVGAFHVPCAVACFVGVT